MEWINYHHLQYFWVVAREGSIRRASEILHVTQPTISSQLRELESSLGVQLFAKQGRGLTLTRVGDQVFRYAEDIFAIGQEMLDLIRGRPLGRPMQFRIGLVDAMPKLVAYRLMEPAFRLTDPVRVVCREGKMDRLVSELTIHHLDVVLSDAPLDPSIKAKVYAHQLGESEISIVGEASLAQRYREGFPASLLGAPFLLPTDNSMLRRSLQQWLDSLDLRVDVRAEFEDSAMLKIAGRAGEGLFATPAVIEQDVKEMYGVELVGRISDISERFYALSVERKLKHPAVVAIFEAARRTLG